ITKDICIGSHLFCKMNSTDREILPKLTMNKILTIGERRRRLLGGETCFHQIIESNNKVAIVAGVVTEIGKAVAFALLKAGYSAGTSMPPRRVVGKGSTIADPIMA